VGAEILRLRLDVEPDLGIVVHALGRVAEADRGADEGGRPFVGEARAEHVVRDAGFLEAPLVRAAVGGDADRDAELSECAVEFHHARRLGQVRAMR
jgi:hypothetical protein